MMTAPILIAMYADLACPYAYVACLRGGQVRGTAEPGPG